MPVDTRHMAYNAKIDRWIKQRDAYLGEDAVKSQSWGISAGSTVSSSSMRWSGELYLPCPEGFQERHYLRYKQRAKWYGATGRTVGGLTGAVFQKPSMVKAGARFDQQKDNITLTGIPLDSFSQTSLRDNLLLGRYGVLLDYSEELSRPYWSGYPAECIINWRTETIGGEDVLTMVVLKEMQGVLQDDGFTMEHRDVYRVAFLNSDGQFQVDTHTRGRGDRDPFVVDSFIPQRRRRPIPFIPFQFFGSESPTPDIQHGPMDALVDINFAYYRHSADYEHGLYLTGLPTPVVTGYENVDDVLRIGSMTAWIIPNPEARVYFLEYQGTGLESHERAMANDKVEMATLGARLLEEQPGVAETLGAVQLRHAGDTGSLRSIAQVTSDSLTQLLRWHHWRDGETENQDDPDISIELNQDLASKRMSAQDLQALMLVWQQGGISQETFLYNLQQGEILPPGVNTEDEIRRIEVAPPARLPFGDEETEENAA